MKRLQTVWLYILASTTILFAVTYVGLQQFIRSDANDPQIQMAQDAALQLDAGISPAQLTTGTVNIRTSLAPFIVVYDKQAQPVGGNGLLENKLPEIPKGVLEAASVTKPNAVTWQPATGVRIASVTVPSKGFYVTAGRSLQEVEKRETTLTKTLVVGWVASMIILAAGDYITSRHTRKQVTA